MKTLPQADNALLVRTDFSSESAWDAICRAIDEPPAEYGEAFAEYAAMNALVGQSIEPLPANVTRVDDPSFAGLSPDELAERLPAGHDQVVLFVADQMTMVETDHPILVVDLFEERRPTLRIVPSQLQAVEGNLSLANMDWEEFAGALDASGVFRGFSR